MPLQVCKLLVCYRGAGGSACVLSPRMPVCGEGELVKTFLLPGQARKGRRLS
jgi:hypothetical protein